MITQLRGTIDSLTPTTMVMECAGVGYLVHISLTTYAAYQGKQEGKILISPIYREDTQLLYGFASQEERELFELLISVSGVGPNTARVILSSYAPEELRTIIATAQIGPLKAVKGIGLKTAQRILVDLKGKISQDGEVPLSTGSHGKGGLPPSSASYDEALAALKMLGYAEPAIAKVLRSLLGMDPTASVESLIKQALKLL